MFNVGAGEMFVIMLLALIVLGPERLPKAMGQVGRAVAQLRRMSSGFQDEIRRAMDPDDAPFRPGEETLRSSVPAIEDEVRVVNAGTDPDEGDTAGEDAASEPEPEPAAAPEAAIDATAPDADAPDEDGDDVVTPLRPRAGGDARATG
jgi:sec-independent protein translocase protein TatB